MSDNKLPILAFTISYVRFLKAIKSAGVDVSRIKVESDRPITGHMVGARMRSLFDVLLGKNAYRSSKRGGQFVWEIGSTRIDQLMNEAPADYRSDFIPFVTKHTAIMHAMERNDITHFWSNPFYVFQVSYVSGETIYEFNEHLIEQVQKYKLYIAEVLTALPSVLAQWNQRLASRKQLNRSLIQQRYDQIAGMKHSPEAYAQSPV